MATIAHPLVHQAAVSDPTKLNPFIKQNRFHVEIKMLDADESAHSIFPDLTSSIPSWSFEPIVDVEDPDLDSDEDDEEDEEYALPPATCELPGEEEDEGDEDDDDDDDIVMLGRLRIAYLVNRDTIVQRGLLSESLLVQVRIVYSDDEGAPVFAHTFTGYVSEKLPNLHGNTSLSGDLTDLLVLDVYEVELWNPL
jgi:hypothetical protein